MLLDEAIPRPALLGEHAWTEKRADQAFQAQLWEHLKGQVLSEFPYLTGPPPVSGRWWRELRNGMDQLRETPTSLGRQVMTQEFINRIPRFIPELAGRDLTVPKWETAHGDLHWANLTSDPLEIIDWEGWGLAPAGYDAAVLHAYALPRPETAKKVRNAFADVLNTPSGRLAQLVIAAEIIQAAERDTVHKRLEPDVRQHLTKMLAQS
ncbi:phosphotransferase [Nocardiopsis sp. NPDC055551]